MKKYEFTGETKLYFGRKLYQIRATMTFASVAAGTVGGWIEKEGNLDHSGDAWVFGDAKVFGDAWVFGNAKVFGNAEVSGDAKVFGDAEVSGNAKVFGNAEVSGNAWVSGDAKVFGDAEVSGNAWVSGDAKVFGDAKVSKPTHLLQIGPIGSRNATITFFRSKANIIKVVCGCFYGTVPEFLAKVEATHGNSKHGKTYKLVAELAIAQIELDSVEK